MAEDTKKEESTQQEPGNVVTKAIAGITRRKTPPTETVGVGGTAIYGGYIQPEEKNKELVGVERWKTYAEVLVNVAIVGAGVRYFLNLVGKAGWSVEPSDEKNAEAVELAKKVDEILNDMGTPFARVMRRASMYKFYGYSIQEWTAKKRKDGVIGLKDIEPRPHKTIERWDTDENGNVIGVMQRSPQTFKEIYLPRQKIVYLCDDSLSDSPEGLGLLRHVVPHARKLMRYEALEGIGFETDMRGIPIGRAPLALLDKLVEQGKISETKKEEMVQVIRDFITNHIRAADTGLVLDSLPYRTTDEKSTPSQTLQWTVDLIKGEAPALEDIAKAITRLIQCIAQLLGVEHLLLGMNDRGSFALSRDKTQNFFLIVDSALEELGDGFRKDIITRLFELNGWNLDLLPKLKPEPIKFMDIEQLAELLKSIAIAGAPLLPDDPAINALRDLAGLPRLDMTGLSADATLGGKGKPDDVIPDDEGEED